MPSLSEFRKKIQGITGTRQITKAMKMVSGARLARAQRQMNEAAAFSSGVEKILAHAFADRDYPASVRCFLAPATAAPPRRIQLLVVASDKGLCGSFNTNVLRHAEDLIKKSPGARIDLYTIGQKCHDYFRRREYAIRHSYVGLFNKLSFADVDKIGDDIIAEFAEHDRSVLCVFHNKFRTLIKQEVTKVDVLPLPQPAAGVAGPDYLYEPPSDEMLPGLIPFYLKARIYAIMRESLAAELAARMTAMDNATRNATKLIDSTTLEMNKTRQATITRELIEIIGTNEVLK